MSKEYDEVMDMICDAARLKMKLNSHKGDITHITLPNAVNKAIEETKELQNAAENDEFVKVIEEAGDVMNFLLSVAVNACRDYRSRK